MIAKPSTEPGKGLVKVVFSKDFVAYGVKPGDVRYVSPMAAEKLRSKWNVVEPPESEKPPAPKFKEYRVVRSLVKQFGTGWYPGSTHEAQINAIDQVQKYVDSGDLVAVEKAPEGIFSSGSYSTGRINYLGKDGVEKADREFITYEVLEYFAYDHLAWRPGLRFTNNILDFSEFVESGKLRIIKNGED